MVLSNKVKVENASGNLFLPYGTDIRFGCDSTWAIPKWSIEYHNGGLNFWKPNGSTNAGDYKLFLKDDGKIDIGCGASPMGHIHAKLFNVIFQPNTGTTSAVIEFKLGTTDPRICTGSSDIVMYRSGTWTNTSEGYASIECKHVFQLSDKEAKINVQPLEKNSLEKICRLNGYSFNWKDDENGKRDIGLIA